jgi:hydroxymethylbilane synthase
VKTIVLGTRTSQLALAQAEIVKRTIESLPDGLKARIEGIRTTGDQRLDINISKSGSNLGKGLFTKELEEALLSRRIDLAVHSLKDLPTELLPELELAATLPRHDPVDLLISKTANSLSEIPTGASVATSSPRRVRQILRLRPDLKIADIRGNVPTRIGKLGSRDSWNSLVLAKAGIERLGYRLEEGRLQFDGHRFFVSDLTEILPAAGQGAIGLEIRAGDRGLNEVLMKINDASTWFCTSVEREFLRLLGGGCNLPLGIRASLNGCEVHCEAIIFDEHGESFYGTLSQKFDQPTAAAAALFKKIYEERK